MSNVFNSSELCYNIRLLVNNPCTNVYKSYLKMVHTINREKMVHAINRDFIQLSNDTTLVEKAESL